MRTDTISSVISERSSGEAHVGHYLIVALQAERTAAPLMRVPLHGLRRLVIGRGDDQRLEPATDSGQAQRLSIPDRVMSSLHAELRLQDDHDVWQLHDADSKNGTTVNGFDITRRVLRDGDFIEMGSTVFIYRAVSHACPPFSELRTEFPSASPRALVTLSPALEEVFYRLKLVIATERPVLLTGPSGTGKEQTARCIHELSGRRGPWVAVNCGGIDPPLLASTLFGVSRGAFTGADKDTPGSIRSADGGTLLLDEIAELPKESQATLLRVLQEGEVVPVGGGKPVPVNVRFISATCDDLLARVAEGSFRNDLYGRIAAHHVHLPALRERREDLGLLAGGMFLGTSERVDLRRDAVRALFAYDWPRNIRELDHLLAEAICVAESGPIDLSHLPAYMHPLAQPKPAVDIEHPSFRTLLIDLLRKHRGNLAAVGRELGRERMQVYRWMRRFGLDAEAYRV